MSTSYEALARKLAENLGDLRPVAVAYLDAPPANVPRFHGSVPSGCTFWGLAAQNRAFYTVAADHFNCPIGSFTHAIDLPPDRAVELEQTLSLMVEIGYVRMEEVPDIPRLPQAPGFIYYAPLGSTTVDPDVVIFAGPPARLMRLQEAAARAGAASRLPLLGRPTCMALPASMAHGAVMSTGCIGNRVYTGLKDEELYLMLPGGRLSDVVEQAAIIGAANQTLEEYHAGRRKALTSTAAPADLTGS